MAFYESVQPEYATAERVAKVMRSYRKKAAKRNARLADAAAPQVDWREMMYEAFVRQSGHDPREFVQRQQQQPQQQPEPEISTDLAASRPVSPQRPSSEQGDQPTSVLASGRSAHAARVPAASDGVSRPASPSRNQ